MELLKTKKEIKKWLIENGITHFEINEDLTVDCFQTVDLCNVKEIKVKFNNIHGNYILDLTVDKFYDYYKIDNFKKFKVRKWNFDELPVKLFGELHLIICSTWSSKTIYGIKHNSFEYEKFCESKSNINSLLFKEVKPLYFKI